MNLILLKNSDFHQTNFVVLTGRRAQHIYSVHRATHGKTLKVGLLDGQMGVGTLSEEPTQNLVKLTIKLDKNPPTPLPATLLLALPRPKSLKKALSTAITAGIKKIILINTARVDKSYWQTPLLTNLELQNELCIEALEQAVDTIMPQIIQQKLFRPFVEDELPQIAKNCTNLLLHPGESSPLPQNKAHTEYIIAIGPEGGFVPFEVELLKKSGFNSFVLGERILRVENAVTAAIAKVFF